MGVGEGRGYRRARCPGRVCDDPRQWHSGSGQCELTRVRTTVPGKGTCPPLRRAHHDASQTWWLLLSNVNETLCLRLITSRLGVHKGHRRLSLKTLVPGQHPDFWDPYSNLQPQGSSKNLRKYRERTAAAVPDSRICRAHEQQARRHECRRRVSAGTGLGRARCSPVEAG